MSAEYSYSFGKYSICVHSALENQNCLSPKMGQYRFHGAKETEESFEIWIDDRIERESDLCGWTETTCDDMTTVSYTRDDKTLFQLQYRGNDYSRLFLHYNQTFSSSFSLGFQHALMVATSDDSIGLHGVTVICGDKAIILSAPSGTGKTTLATLLQKHCDTAVINGDFALLSTSTEYGIVFEPTPFCGTSNICHNYRLPISQIVILEQATEVRITPLSAREAAVQLLSNSFIPSWNLDLKRRIQTNAMQIVNQVPICRLSFPPTKEAAQKLFEYVNS